MVGGSTAAVLAIVSVAVNGVNGDFLLLAGLAAVVFAFPWHRLSALKAGPFEFSLEQGQIKGAIDSIDVDGPEKGRIEGVLSRLAADIELARGGRVLWVDDEPKRVVGERRLLRALEIETVMVASCREAAEILKRDDDFDLLITSLEKETERKAIKDAENPAVLFVQWLRGKESTGISELLGAEPGKAIDDPVVNSMAVIVYAAYDSLADIRTVIRPLNRLEPGVDASRSVDDLLRKAIRSLADYRSNPIEVSKDKKIPARMERPAR